ncbi:MAG: hypothetical protein ACRD0K_09850 [Egibacteraceae bacterium]
MTDSADPHTISRTPGASGRLRLSSYSRWSAEGSSGECRSRYGISSSTTTCGLPSGSGDASGAAKASSQSPKRSRPLMPNAVAQSTAKRSSACARSSSSAW